MTALSQETSPRLAIVSRRPSERDTRGQYLLLNGSGAPHRTRDAQAATVFGSMREAMGATARLPSYHRVFSVPRHAGLVR